MSAYRDSADGGQANIVATGKEPYQDMPQHVLEAFAEADIISWETYYEVIAQRRGVDAESLYNPWLYLPLEDRS